MPRYILMVMLIALGYPTLILAQFRTVTVQNANSNPVPTTIQNTPSVNATIVGTPSVNATITGTASVNANITNTPNVSVSNLPTGQGGPSATTVVLTKNLNDPAQQPFQISATCSTVVSGATSCTSRFTVPAGKVFVIEYMQLKATQSISVPLNFSLQTVAGGQTLSYDYPVGGFVSNTETMGEHQVRLYADPGTVIQLTGTANSSGSTTAFAALLSGHLVNVP